MPDVKSSEKKQRKKIVNNSRKKQPDFFAITRLIRGYATPPQVAVILNCSPTTARKKMNAPDLFTLGELKWICHETHIPVEEMQKAAMV